MAHSIRDVLAREFPEAVALRRRLPTVSPTAAFPAGLAAIGGFFLAEQLGRALLGLVTSPLDREALTRLGPTLYEVGGVPAAAVGLAVARRAGDRRAVLIFLLYLATSALVALARTVALAVSCEPLDDACVRAADPLGVIVSQWPTAVGLLGSFAVMPLVRRGSARANPALEGAGVIGVGALAFFAALSPWPWLSLEGQTWTIQFAFVAVQVASGAAAGLVIASRAGGRIAPALTVAAILALSWLTFFARVSTGMLNQPVSRLIDVVAASSTLLMAVALVVVATVFRRRPGGRASRRRAARRSA